MQFTNDNLRQQLSMYNNCYVTFYTPQHNNCTDINSDGGTTAVTVAMKWLCNIIALVFVVYRTGTLLDHTYRRYLRYSGIGNKFANKFCNKFVFILK